MAMTNYYNREGHLVNFDPAALSPMDWAYGSLQRGELSLTPPAPKAVARDPSTTIADMLAHEYGLRGSASERTHGVMSDVLQRLENYNPEDTLFTPAIMQQELARRKGSVGNFSGNEDPGGLMLDLAKTAGPQYAQDAMQDWIKSPTGVQWNRQGQALWNQSQQEPEGGLFGDLTPLALLALGAFGGPVLTGALGAVGGGAALGGIGSLISTGELSPEAIAMGGLGGALTGLMPSNPMDYGYGDLAGAGGATSIPIGDQLAAVGRDLGLSGNTLSNAAIAGIKAAVTGGDPLDAALSAGVGNEANARLPGSAPYVSDILRTGGANLGNMALGAGTQIATSGLGQAANYVAGGLNPADDSGMLGPIAEAAQAAALPTAQVAALPADTYVDTLGDWAGNNQTNADSFVGPPATIAGEGDYFTGLPQDDDSIGALGNQGGINLAPVEPPPPMTDEQINAELDRAYAEGVWALPEPTQKDLMDWATAGTGFENLLAREAKKAVDRLIASGVRKEIAEQFVEDRVAPQRAAAETQAQTLAEQRTEADRQMQAYLALMGSGSDEKAAPALAGSGIDDITEASARGELARTLETLRQLQES